MGGRHGRISVQAGVCLWWDRKEEMLDELTT